jgi:phosphoglycolate phosphatase-like HAD superfamily hydrolase
MINAKKIIFFDFDGVIADSFDASIEAFKTINPKITADEWRQLFNNNFYETFNNWKNDEHKTLEETKKIFFKTYLSLMRGKNKNYFWQI